MIQNRQKNSDIRETLASLFNPEFWCFFVVEALMPTKQNDPTVPKPMANNKFHNMKGSNQTNSNPLLPNPHFYIRSA